MIQIKEVHENIFNTGCDVLVNPVNTVGVMGAGLALQFKKKYPNMFTSYKNFCDDNYLQIGTIHYFSTKDHQYIVNLPTKKHWKDASRLEYVEQGIDALIEFLYKFETVVETVAIPKLGCGLGGLKWDDVKKIIVEKFKEEKINKKNFKIYLLN